MARSAKILKRPQLKRVFLGCEGDSERSYGAWLQAVAQDCKIPVTIDTYPDTGSGNQPFKIIEHCISEMVHRQKRYGPYLVRGILLDSDNLDHDPERNRRALELAQIEKVDIIFQHFEHEAFLLRHIPGYEHHRPNKGEGRQALEAVWPGYKRRHGKMQLYDKFGLQDLRRVCTVERDLYKFLKRIGFPI